MVDTTTASINGRTFTLRMYPHPGKYEGELAIAEYLDALSLDGADAECGDVDDAGYYSLLRGPFHDFTGEHAEDLTEDEKMYLGLLAGVIILTDTNGFVWVTYPETEEDLDVDWEGAEDAVENFYDDDVDEEDDG